jgi:putative redox protein
MCQRFSFQNSYGQTLSARIELPSNQKPAAFALFAHCFTCSKDLLAVKNISRALNEEGIGVMRFDFTGLGQSEGDFADSNFSSNVQDLVAAANALAAEFEAPQLIIGHSLGGAAAIFAASEIESIKAVATIGSPSQPEHVQHLLKGSLDTIAENDSALVNIGGRDFTIKKQFVDDLQNRNMFKVVKALRKPILVLHSPQDTTVGIQNAADIYSAAMHPKSFVSLDGADHLLSRKTDSTYAGSIIAGWASRYLDLSKNETFRAENQVSVHIGSEGFTTDIVAGKHALRADEPESVGGDNFGPNPYDLLLASLGACTAMTIRMYADRKGWPLEDVFVHLAHDKKHASDCDSCETTSGKIDHIEKSIEIIGELDDTQRKRLLEIADKCPVHRTLHSEVVVKTSEKV